MQVKNPQEDNRTMSTPAPVPEFPPDSYFGQCRICGKLQDFVRPAEPH